MIRGSTLCFIYFSSIMTSIQEVSAILNIVVCHEVHTDDDVEDFFVGHFLFDFSKKNSHLSVKKLQIQKFVSDRMIAFR